MSEDELLLTVLVVGDDFKLLLVIAGAATATLLVPGGGGKRMPPIAPLAFGRGFAVLAFFCYVHANISDREKINTLLQYTYTNIEIHFDGLAFLEAKVQLWRITLGLFARCIVFHLDNSDGEKIYTG